MEKKKFVALVMGAGGLLFALGMCMCLLPEWGTFNVGIGFGVGMCLALLSTELMILGILIGIVGNALLLGLLPMCQGWKESKKAD